MKIRNTLVIFFAAATIYAAAKNSRDNAPMEHFDVNSLVFIEEDDLGLGFDTAPYLPENFDPYCGEFSLESINYIDEAEELELDFDTSGYLPIGFDPYIQ
ncbi:hypothetical protein [Flagellimonas flava]|uniref:Uncharacterized protein n=1 Tax=Flagellimonas flava TaxID=570519 RepID=A0A1M5JT94_9FLAO|nr:hypothetical protein [Allomuricauda flava]SHG43766.1 hypothetical protein SAMN04488116_1207 [Allomuricauda flava]